MHVRLARWCFIISSNDILNLDMIQRLCSTVLFLGNIDIVFLDHIKMMAVTVAQSDPQL